MDSACSGKNKKVTDIPSEHDSYYAKFFKRWFDVALILIAILLLSPVLVLIGAVVLWRLGWPILFFQTRMGYQNLPFRMVKFRTMSTAVDSRGDLLDDSERVTRLGRILRRHSFDELPQIFQILGGQMSLVGPRPLPESYRVFLSDDDLRRHNVRPGLTGLAQVSGRNSVSWETRFQLDKQYVNEMGFWLDVKIIGKTLLTLFRREGTNDDGSSIIAEPKHPSQSMSAIQLATAAPDVGMTLVAHDQTERSVAADGAKPYGETVETAAQ